MKLKRKKFIEKIINLLLNILIFIFGIILLISIYTGVQTKILGNEYTNFFGYSLFEVQTGSMADTINAGDWIIVRLSQKVNLNDIVTYESDGEYITHRIIEVYKGTYITKGDANNAKDDPIDQKQIVGKVVKILASFGIIRKTLFNPSVLITLIITLFIINLTFKKNSKSSMEERKFNTDVITKNIDLFLDAISKKSNLLFKKIRKLINSNRKIKRNTINSKRIEPSSSMHKTESKNLENYKKSNDFKEQTLKAETENYYKDTDELNKTSFFRVIPVDANEVDDKFKDVPTKAQIEEYYKDTDELDKTSFYRMIPVDASEVDNTFLEIAKNEIKETEQNNKNKESSKDLESKQEEKKENENLTKIDLELLKNKKGKNIIDTVMLIKKEELNELIDILVKDNKPYDKEIKETFINTYIDAKYYNYYGNKDIEYHGKNLISKIEEAIKGDALATQLINSYKANNTRYNDMVDIYANTLILIANLDNAKDSITDLKPKKEFYKKEIKKYAKDWDNQKIEYLIEGIMKIQKKYDETSDSLLKNLETNMFNLKFNKLSTKKDMYGLELEHNITFSKVYSDYIIDKTYTEGIIAEDKMLVLLNLLSVQLIKDMTLTNFNKKYILYMPKSLYMKEKKFEKLLKMIDDKYAKDNVIILISFEDLLDNKQIIKKIRKMDYKFALVFDGETIIKEKDRGNIYIADYIFINKKAIDVATILPFIPQELINNIIYEDIVEKVGDFGGE